MAADEVIKTNGFSKKKIRQFLKDVDKADDWSASEHGKISQQMGDKINNVREAGEVIGIKKRVMNRLISIHRTNKKWREGRDDFVQGLGDNDAALGDQLDAVLLAAGLLVEDDEGEGDEDETVEEAPAGEAKPSLVPEFQDDKTGDKGGPAKPH
jgi:hypothetical protein